MGKVDRAVSPSWRLYEPGARRDLSGLNRDGTSRSTSPEITIVLNAINRTFISREVGEQAEGI